MVTTDKCKLTDLGSNIISLVLLAFRSRKLFVHHSENRFTSEKYMSMSLQANSRLRIAESSANLTMEVTGFVDVRCTTYKCKTADSGRYSSGKIDT